MPDELRNPFDVIPLTPIETEFMEVSRLYFSRLEDRQRQIEKM
jgi:hypothetical protein